VSQTPDPVPQRIGDAERDQAATYLREALAQGRLEPEEFDERLDQALKARTQSDLEPLFEDLPGPKPGQGLAAAPGFQAPPWQGGVEPPVSSSQDVAVPAASAAAARPKSSDRALMIVSAIAWPLTIMAMFATHWQFWWLVFIPIAISSIAGGRRHQERDRDGRHHGGHH
jgi:hypothetical protein